MAKLKKHRILAAAIEPPKLKKMVVAPRVSRRSSKQPPRRFVSVSETRMWSNRPYGCNSWKGAVEHDKRMQREELLRANSAFRVVREAVNQRKATPDWCYKHEHPLRTGKKCTLYARWDFLTPIFDSMSAMDKESTDAFGVSTMISKKHRMERAKSNPEPFTFGRPKPGEIVHQWTCPGCGNHDRSKLITDHEGMTCPCGVFVGVVMVSGNREKLGASQNDDKTTHADRTYEARTDKFDRPPPSTSEARAARMCAAKALSTGSGVRVAGYKRMCDAQTLSERQLAKELVSAQVRAGTGLEPRDQVKQRQVLQCCEAIFKSLNPIDHEIKRQVRIVTDQAYVDAVQHASKCSNRHLCDVRLAERSPAVIAQACFEYTINALVDGTIVDANVDQARLLDVRERMSRSMKFQNTSSMTQVESGKVMLNLLRAPTFNICVECTPQTASPAAPSFDKSVSFAPILPDSAPDSKKSTPSLGLPHLRSLESPCFTRTPSLCSNGEWSPTVPKKVQHRDAIAHIFLSHRSEMKTCIRDTALGLTQNDAFSKACASDQRLLQLDNSQFAFCLLNAVAREQTPNKASFVNPIQMNAGIADRLGLGLLFADEAVKTLCSLLPDESKNTGLVGEPDDLFS